MKSSGLSADWRTIANSAYSGPLIKQASASPVAFELANIQLSGWLSGSTMGKPVLCLHGWLDNANSFLPLAAVMSSYSLLSLDLPGHGLSSHRSADAHYSLFEYVADVAEFIQQQGWDNLQVIGHSMGGMVATALAAAMPELIAKLVLIDSLGFVTTSPTDTAMQLRKAIQSRHGRFNKRKPNYPSLEHAALARQHQSDFSLEQALILSERGSCIVASSPSTYSWRADMRLRELSLQRLCVEQAKGLIAELKCPVLALMAEDGIDLMQQNLSLYQDSYPQLHLQSFSGGHHLHMTNAKTVANAISAFLSTTD